MGSAGAGGGGASGGASQFAIAPQDIGGGACCAIVFELCPAGSNKRELCVLITRTCALSQPASRAGLRLDIDYMYSSTKYGCIYVICCQCD